MHGIGGHKLNEIREAQKDKFCMFSLFVRLKIKMIKLMEIEFRSMVTRFWER